MGSEPQATGGNTEYLVQLGGGQEFGTNKDTLVSKGTFE
jgi:hypothetical protein